MVHYELVTAEEYATLPSDPKRKFVALERICRQKLRDYMSKQEYPDSEGPIHKEYMIVVSVAAKKLGVTHHDLRSNPFGKERSFDDFLFEIIELTTNLNLDSIVESSDFVNIAPRTRALIELEIKKLRRIVESGDFTFEIKERIFSKLDDLLKEIQGGRAHLAKTMAVLIAVSFGISSATSFLADAPGAINTIMSLIGKDKSAEEAEVARLGEPAVQKALPAPSSQATEVGHNELDDEIPF